MQNKKASLELSIRTIVIVILAMTLLGLGLGFIRNMFTDIGGIREDITEQVRQNIIADLRNNDKKISFPKTEVEIDKGSSEILTVGIRNKEDDTFMYKMGFTPISGPDDLSLINNWFQFGEDKYELSASESDIRNVRLSIPRTAKTGSYFLTFDVNKFLGVQVDGNGAIILDDEGNSIEVYESYATKDFFIVVRG